MKKNIHWSISKTILLILIVFKIVLGILNQDFNIYILNQPFYNLVVNISVVITFAHILKCYIKNWIRHVISFLAVASIVGLLFMSIFTSSAKSYFYFESPDKSRILVVEEESYLFYGGSNFYEKKGYLLVKDLRQKVSTDDGYRPFTNNHYKLKWLDNNTVELEYDFGAGTGGYHKAIIKLD